MASHRNPRPGALPFLSVGPVATSPRALGSDPHRCLNATISGLDACRSLTCKLESDCVIVQSSVYTYRSTAFGQLFKKVSIIRLAYLL